MNIRLAGILGIVLLCGIVGCTVEKGEPVPTPLGEETPLPSGTPAKEGSEVIGGTGTVELKENILEEVSDNLKDYRFYVGFGYDIKDAKFLLHSKKDRKEISRFLKQISKEQTVIEEDWIENGHHDHWILVFQNKKNKIRYVMRVDSIIKYESYDDIYVDETKQLLEIVSEEKERYFYRIADNQADDPYLSKYIARQVYGHTIEGTISAMDPEGVRYIIENAEFGSLYLQCKKAEKGLRTGDKVKVQFPEKPKGNKYFLDFGNGAVKVTSIRRLKNGKENRAAAQ